MRSETTEERKNNYVRELYTEGLFAEMFKPGTQDHIGYRASKDGLLIYDGALLTHTAESRLSWPLTRDLIEALIVDGDYLDEPTQHVSEQMSLFEPEDSMPTKLARAGRQLAVSQEVIDSFLRLGGCTKNSASRIYGYYRRANDVDDNIRFLRMEYQSDEIGLIIGERKAAAVWDEDGVRISEGEHVSDNMVFLTWADVDKRIRQLLEAGQYLPQVEAEVADDIWEKHVAQYTGYVYQDVFSGVPEEDRRFAPRLLGESDAYYIPIFHDSDRLRLLTSEMKKNSEQLDKYPGRYPKLTYYPNVISWVESFERDPIEYPHASDTLIPPTQFVSQDMIDHTLIRQGSSFSDGKYRIYSYFCRHADKAKRAAFLQNEYGIGGSYTGRRNVEHDSKGLCISGGLMSREGKLLLKWPQVAKRIDELIRSGRYMSAKELEHCDVYEREQIAQAILNFYRYKPEDVAVPFETPSFAFSTDISGIMPQLESPERVAEIYEMMRETFEAEMPGSRGYESDKVYLEDVRRYRDGEYDLFPSEPVKEQDAPIAEELHRVEADNEDTALQSPSATEKKYDIALGTEVYIGSQEYTVISLDGDTVELNDGSMFPVEMAKAEFYRKISENPLNDGLVAAPETEIQDDEPEEEPEDDPVDMEAERAADAYEAEFGADGYRVFPGNAPHAEQDREIAVLDKVLYRLKIEGITLAFDGDTLRAGDEDGNVWTGESFYKFLVDEVFVFEEDGSVQGLEPELLDSFRELSEKYGVPVETSAMPAMMAVQEKNIAPVPPDPYVAVPQADRHNYRITDDNVGVGTPSERYRHNVEAIRLMKQLEAERRLATTEEQGILAQYVGWGGLADCFDERSGHYEELKSLLTEDEYAAARESTLTAFYTPPVVVDAIYTALGNMGFKRGNILEPSCGVGNIIGRLPDSMSESKVYGVELDSISGRIARQLYQRANITVSGFEKTQFPDSFFDVAVGNVPFGQYKLSDKKYDKYHFLVHDYFIAKALDKVRPGGVIAFITSSGTMDKANPAVRKYIAQRADLLGAIRLPNDTFKAAAGTEVTSDILFFQKYDSLVNEDPNWVHLGKDSNGIAMNSYFADNPQMVLGEMVMTSGPFGPEPTCVPYEGQDLRELLNEAVSDIHAEISERESDELTGEETDQSIPADPTVRNYSFTLVNSKVYYRENSVMTLVDTTATAENRIKGMIALRDTVKQLIDAQLNDYPDREIEILQRKLDSRYDDFTKKYGLINSRANASVFRDDSSYFLLCSLEVLDDNKELKAKADIFSKRTINPTKVIDRVDTASEALALSMGERAMVDMDYMSSLTGKSEEELFADLKGVVFLNPLHGNGNQNEKKYLMSDEYLSGNVREKLAVARRTAELYPDDYKVNVEALERVQPQDLNATEIGVRLGSTWIPDEYIQQFMFELLGTPYYLRYRMNVKYIPQTAQWVISEKNYDRANVRANSVYGTSRINAYSIIEETLNLKDVRINDYVEDENGNKRAVLNKKETAIAQGKQDQIKRAFEEWIWKDPERRETLVKLYNEKFNSTRPREYDGRHIRFYGMNPEITLRPHQANAVARILYGGNTLLAHVVGAGKTFTMVAAAQESKRLGLCNKSMFVVPNHLIEQWATEYLQLYPSANILVATKKDFETKNRKKFCARVATGDYDAIIIGHSQFEKIPMSIGRQIESLQGEINEILASIEQLKYERGERLTVKQLEKTRKSLQARLDKLNDQSRKDDVVTFEQLGVDRIFVDEAHFYKNLFLFTKMRNVAGIAQTEAQKSSDLYMKCRYLDEITGGKGVVFATGTPISNSMVELYTMQRYLQYEGLRTQGLTQFDAWASTYGETVTAIELSPTGNGYRTKTRFAKFYNIPELMSMFKQVADVQTSDMLKLPVPKANYSVEKVPASDIQKDMVQSFADRAERVHNRMVPSSEDNMLLITNDGRKAALDQRLINQSLPDDERSKVNACVRNVYDIWEQNMDKKSAQLIFCDLSTPHNDGKFNVYDDIRTKLIERGVPAEEIAFIHNADTDAKKKELFAKVRSGQVRVLLGSTFKMGAGTNVQKRLIALHDVDCPWRPSDLEQRAGRIVRQGNENPEVSIIRYITEGTFDAYSYQLLESKQKFISQIMTSKSPVRVAEDVDETALSFAEIKALASGNPKIMEKMQLDADVAKLKLQKASHLSQRYMLEDKLIKEYPKAIAEMEERIAGYVADMETAETNTHPNSEEKNFSPMTVQGKKIAVKADAGKAILMICKQKTSPDPAPIGEYRGFRMELGFDQFDKEFFIYLRGKLSHRVLLGQDANGIVTRLDNMIESFGTKKQNCLDQLSELHKQVENAKAEATAPFADEEILQSKSRRLDELNAELNLDRAENEIADEEPEQGTESDEKENARSDDDRDER